MRYIWWTTVGILVVFLCVIFIDLPGTDSFLGRSVSIVQGIDIAGGARVLECAQKGYSPSSSDMSTAANVLRNRASGGYGVAEPQVNQVGSNCISVELPGIKDIKSALSSLGATGYLAITDSSTQSLAQGTKVTLVCPASNPKCAPGVAKGTGVTDLNAKPFPKLQILVPGTDVTQGSAQVSADATTGQPTVLYNMNGSGSNAWCTFTSNNVGKYSAIVLDGVVVSDPVIQGAICGG